MRVAHLAAADFIHYYLLLPQLKALKDAGIQPVAISSSGPFVELLEKDGIEHIELKESTRGFDLMADIRTMRSLWKILRTHDIDLLHTHNPKPGVYGRVVGRLAGVPAIVNTNHGVYASPEDRFLKKAIVYPLEAIASRFSDYELIQSIEDYELLTRTRITRPKRTVHLGNGIDIERFNPARFDDQDRRRIRAELRLDPDKPTVGIVARLVHEKGLREFFAAAAILSPSHQFIVVGASEPEKWDGVTDSEIADAERQGVRFLGSRSDVDELLSIMSVFALPSYREGVPRVAMEAAASGIPVIASDIRGCREVVVDGVTGLLVPKYSAGQLADAILRITGDPTLAARMSIAARAKAVEQFDESNVVSMVLEMQMCALESRGVVSDLDDSSEGSGSVIV